MTELAVDARAKDAGGPGLHALIVAASRYAHLPAPDEEPDDHQRRYGLGLRRLTAAARTGFLVYEWLLESRPDLPVPLVTCRLLLAPVPSELQDVHGLAAVASSASLDSVLKAAKAWRDDAASHPDNVTLFYFAGHGLQRKRGDHVLLLEDLGDGVGGTLKNAVDSFSLVQGMAPAPEYARIARRQLYFFDACRMRSVDAWQYEDKECTPVFDTPSIDSDDRVAPEYYTALPGMEAFAIPGEQTTFSKALLRCLRGGGAEELEGRWCVTLDSLNRGLRHHLGAVMKGYEAEQMFRLDGLTQNVVLRYLPEPPDVDLDVEVVPDTAAAGAAVTVNDYRQPPQTFGPPLDPHPYSTSLKAGRYLVTTRDGAGGERQALHGIAPPHGRWVLEV